jgi:hypothetical protein
MRLFIPVLALSVLASCGGTKNEKKSNRDLMPAKAPSVASARSTFKNAGYKVEDVGFIRTFMGEEDPATWSADMNDTSSHFRNFVDDRKNFSLSFLNDTTVKMIDDKKEVEAFYELEKDSTGAVLLLVKYEDAEFSFPGSDEPMMVTYTYKIRGLDENNMFVETPRSYNQKAVVLLMNKKQ